MTTNTGVVTENWQTIDAITGVALVDSINYTIQNVGDKRMYVRESTAMPAPSDVGHIVTPASDEGDSSFIGQQSGTNMYVKTTITGDVTSVAITETP